MLFRMAKRTNPINDAKRRSLNCLAVRQGWANARTKVISARKANSMPGGLSSIPITTAAIANKAQIAKRIRVRVLLLGMVRASNKLAFFSAWQYIYYIST